MPPLCIALLGSPWFGGSLSHAPRAVLCSVLYVYVAGKKVPRFLLPPHHPLHIPPHVVAYSLLRKGAEAYRKVDLDDGITTCPNCKAAVVRAPTTATTNAGGSGVGASRGTDDDDEHTTGESSDSDE